ncbi:hypothetical protein H2199_000988 [Coniosporium tulheliwenetii]|uniref:Uncharacterized protein n=1 Tax=Coniosporium tulheliwenetii TaxID=3383036 RepID=A0ACC2ZNF2_9PEZI|nr:hypothetical protein H2199_000988 [Cladosporium sp. JES 115]
MASSAPLRQATLILPKTGERVKRSITLRSPPPDEHGDDQTPLLGRRRSSILQSGTTQSIWRRSKKAVWQAYAFATSKTGQSILKCSLAYLIGSMATFVAPIARFLGKNDGKHMVATVTVYFHPARSAGSMQEATLFALVAFAYAAFVSFTSMAVSGFFGHHGLLVLGHAVVLIVFCGGGLGFVGWLKQRLGDPLVNVACSLTSLAIITILTKEGSVQAGTFSYEKIFQVLKMVIMGVIATAAVSLAIKPVSARKELREDLRKATDSLSDMMSMITTSFLSGEDELNDPSFVAASTRYKSSFNSLTKNLKEAKNEHYLLGTEKEYEIEARLVKCMERLAQNIGGLRSAASTQFTLLKSSYGPGHNSLASSFHRLDSPQFPDFTSVRDRIHSLSAIYEAPEDSSDAGGDQTPKRASSIDASSVATVLSPADMFSTFISHLGPPMKSLAFTLKQMLEELPFGPGPGYAITVGRQFRESLEDAINLFSRARREALALVYKTKAINKARSLDVAADYEEVAASCGYFSSSLQDFAEDMIEYLDIVDELKEELERSPRRRTWNWILFWRNRRARTKNSMNQEMPTTVENAEQGLSREIPSPPRGPNTTDPEKPHQHLSYTFRVWRALRFFRRDDIKYAIKVGIGAIIYAMWSFIPSTRPFYSHWRGEWGLLSYMLVCSMTIGASNTTGFQRFLGTCMGAVFGILAWIIADENPYVLAFLGWLVSLGCFYIIIGKGKGPMGRYIMLTYNLSALYAYSLSIKDEEDDEDEGGISPEIWEIVLHRVVAVLTGCIWGLIVTRLIWPISARRKLKDGICVLWLRMGLIWKRDPLALLLEDQGQARGGMSYVDIRESIELQRFLTHLETLRQSARHEFELQGPFPDAIMKRILEATGRMLDAFHAMNVIIVKDLKASPAEAEILRYTKHERMELSWRISHLFSVLASSMKLEYPMNDALPNIEHTRDRLLAKVFDFRKNAPSKDDATDEDYELLYAYGQLAQDITAVGQDIEQLYGVLNEDNLKLQ